MRIRRHLEDLPKHYPKAVEHFFITYKHLQNAQVESQGWVGAAEPKAISAMKHYRETFPPTRI